MTQRRSKQEQPQDPLAALSEQGRDILSRVALVLEDRALNPGALLDRPQITIDPQDVAQVCRILKNDPKTSFNTLLCIAAVDYKDRIQMVYLLLSTDGERVLAIKTDLPYDNPELPTVSGVWKAADWHEREAHDLFGVRFTGHPDLSPLLLYEGFEGYPGRKEFPFHEYDEY